MSKTPATTAAKSPAARSPPPKRPTPAKTPSKLRSDSDSPLTPRELPTSPSVVAINDLHNVTEMLKFTTQKQSKPLLRNFYVSDNNLYLRWNSNWWAFKPRERKQIDLRSIRRIQQGHLSARFEAVKHNFEGTAPRSFSIVYGDDLQTLDIIADTDEKFRTWYGGLKQIVRDMADTKDSSKLDQLYLRAKFDQADEDENGSLSKIEVERLLASLHINMIPSAIDAIFARANVNGSGELDRNEFSNLVQMLRRRHDLEYIWHKIVNHQVATAKGITDCESFGFVVLQDPTESLISRRSLNGTVSASDFLSFWNSTQGDASRLTLDQAVRMISAHMPATGDATTNTAADDSALLSYAGFLSIMTSVENSVYNPEAIKLKSEDLRQPLSHYYIATSHNTYLTGDQLTGTSSVDRYVDVLEKGCRCVELDIWDGEVDAEDRKDGVASFVQPVITHGGTLTTKITFADVVEGIQAHAFEDNPMPVILSFENHCCHAQQKVMADVLKHIFKNNGVLLEPDPKTKLDLLPSPEELKNKIIIKGKRGSLLGDDATEVTASLDGDEDDDDESDMARSLDQLGVEVSMSSVGTSQAKDKKKKKKKTPTHLDLAKITYLGAAHAPKSFDEHTSSMIPCDIMSSYSETKTLKHLAKPASVQDWIRHNAVHMSRIYPAGTRVNSSNLDPMGPWFAGNHMVALNYQTEDMPMFLNHGMFLQNNQCGYVLKPRYMIDPTASPMPPIILNVHVIGGSQIPKPAAAVGKSELLNPYVKVTLCGVGSDDAEFKTKSVKDNGFNPIWDDVFSFSVARPECAMLLFRVYDSSSDREDVIAFSAIPVVHLMEGFRCVTLYDKHGSRQGDIMQASLSVRVQKILDPASPR